MKARLVVTLFVVLATIGANAAPVLSAQATLKIGDKMPATNVKFKGEDGKETTLAELRATGVGWWSSRAITAHTRWGGRDDSWIAAIRGRHSLALPLSSSIPTAPTCLPSYLPFTVARGKRLD
ncbi:MAG: hypothetical protein N2689_12835 [Verrucomicrobiae bacterium]|nr:hypothetical protein [Verrucomicrobiae bacterium]